MRTTYPTLRDKDDSIKIYRTCPCCHGLGEIEVRGDMTVEEAAEYGRKAGIRAANKSKEEKG